METQAPRRRWYQFSIREMLIATVAVAAMTALFVENRPYSPTIFLQNLDERSLLTQCCADLGVTLGSIVEEGVKNRVWGGHGNHNATLTISEPDIDVLQTEVMQALRSSVEELLADSNCVITGRTTVATTGDERLVEFHFRYHRGSVQGVIRVISLEQPEDESRLRFLTDEW